MDGEKLREIIEETEDKYRNIKAQNVEINMARGKPAPEQLDLSNGLFKMVDATNYKSEDGTDCRNYGIVDGLPEAKELFAQILDVNADDVIVGGNSSLNLMYDTISKAMILGVPDGDGPWCKMDSVKFLCPSPGYDRHFNLCQDLGIEMITVDMKESGPDIDKIEKLVYNDETIKGIWCVPKYSNPDGITYSDEVVVRLAKMKTKAKDFRIFCDNAYAIHHLTDNPDKLRNILTACKEAGNPNRVFMFASTSKITFPGAGISAIASSKENLDFIRKHTSYQTIGPDKVNQLRHVRFLKNIENIKEHMKKHAAIIKPKFDLVLDKMENELGDRDIAWWNKPRGGYFISLYTLEGCAKEIVRLASEAGLTLTGAGATYPFGNNPKDNNIRIAPTLPSTDDLEKGIDLLCVCVKLASYRKMHEERIEGKTTNSNLKKDDKNA